MEAIFHLFGCIKDFLSDITILNTSFWSIFCTAFSLHIIIKLFVPGGEKIGK